MAGYIGSKAVNLSTTGADINGDANIDGDLSFRDNDKIKLGAGSDLQIYHDGSNSFISDESTGNLVIRGSSEVSIQDPTGSRYSARFVDTDAVRLYHNGSQKLATTSTGIDVTGTVTADALNVSAASPNIDVTDTGTSHASQDFLTNSNAVRATIGVERSAGGGLFVGSSPYAAVFGTASAGNTEFATNNNVRMTLDASGNVGIGTSSPARTLEVYSTAPAIKLNNGTNAFTIGTGAFVDGSNSLVFFDEGVGERMRIDSSGNLGIGGVPTNASDHKSLALFGNASTGAGFIEFNDTSGNADAAIFADDGNLFINADYDNTTADSSIRFRVDGSSEKMRIDSSGNIGIGTSSPSAPLEVTRSTEGIAQYITNTGSNQAYTAYGNSDNPPWSQDFNTAGGLLVGIDSDESGVLFQGGNYDLRLGTNGTDRMRITSGGSIKMPNVYNDTTASAANLHISSAGGQLFRSTSSARYKNTIANASFGIVELMALRPVTYKGNNDGDTVFGGLIAEEVHDAGLVEFVQYNEEGEPDALAYGNMVSLCIKAIQEQQATITDLKARVATLEAN